MYRIRWERLREDGTTIGHGGDLPTSRATGGMAAAMVRIILDNAGLFDASKVFVELVPCHLAEVVEQPKQIHPTAWAEALAELQARIESESGLAWRAVFMLDERQQQQSKAAPQMPSGW